MPNEVTIAPIDVKHIDSFRRCLDLVARERKYLVFVEAPDSGEVDRFIRPNIEKKVPQFVALDGDKVVGWCDVLPKDREAFRHSGILGIAVHPDYRGKGIGTRLMEMVISKARAVGLTRIELQVFGSNKVAQAFFEKSGFSVERIKKKGRYIDGEYDDVICMALTDT